MRFNVQYLHPCDNYEIIAAIDKLDPNKSSGYIDIPIILIKQSKFIIADAIRRAFNYSIENGIYPDILKVAKVTPVHKGGSQSDLGRYRPISVLSPINKIFESLLHKRLISFWTKHKLFRNTQFGFRQNYSTQLAVTHLYESILEKIDKNSNLCGVFLDLAKAFDSVNHQILLDKLEHYGIRGVAFDLFNSYLTNRKQYTSLDNLASSILSVNTGVPQGSVLGPFLFLVYMNDFPLCTNCNTTPYADDTVLTIANSDLTDLKKKTDIELNNVTTWFNSNKLTLNYSKTQCLLFSNKSLKHSFKIKLGDVEVTNNNTVKYLGTTLDDKLTWQYHIQIVAKKISIADGILSKLRHYVPKGVLIKVYYGIAYPYLLYSVTNWGNAAKTHIQKIQVLQNRLIKIISNTFKFKTKLLPLYQELNILKFHNIYRLEVIKFMNKYKNGKLPALFNDYFTLTSKVHNHMTVVESIRLTCYLF